MEKKEVIIIEIRGYEAGEVMAIVGDLHRQKESVTLKDAPCILSEIHEDFEEAIPAQPKPEKKPKAKKESPSPLRRGKGGRPRKKAAEEKELKGDEPDDVP